MLKQVGTQSIVGSIVPKLGRIQNSVTLSKAAKLRLSWLDYAQDHSVTLTCRHYGIARCLFYKWKRRYDRCGLKGLEQQSRRPQRTRMPATPLNHQDLVVRLRRANPEYSKYKLAVILKRDYGIVLSASTIGRLIQRKQLFLTPPVKPKRHPQRAKAARLRKPAEWTTKRPGDLVEVDVKHLPCLGDKRYGFVAIDVATRRVAVHVASTISAHQASIAWEKVLAAWGAPKAVLCDNGSENLGSFAGLLRAQGIPQYFARPRTPKDKPHVERVIGSLERECIQWGGLVVDIPDQQAVIDTWLTKYHSYRPHQALGYLTPDEYQAKLEGEVSTMW
ncbi:MAG TPA: integrase core domain-containing protein [Candidatus Saccharimonadales bacterium]